MKRLVPVFWVIVVFFFIPVSLGKDFPDVKSPVLKEAIKTLAEKKVLKGYPDGKFRPEKAINRAEALKIIFESRGIAPEEATDSGFKDVPQNEWYAKYVTSARKMGLIQGYEDGTYKPDQVVNTAEFIKIAFLAQDFYAHPEIVQDALDQYQDLKLNDWFLPFAAFGVRNSFLDKTKKLEAAEPITRGKAALIIFKIDQFRAKGAKVASEEEKSAVISCNTCVRGIDLMKEFPDLMSHRLVKIENGKLYVGEFDASDLAFTRANLIRDIDWAEYRDLIRTRSEDEKVRIIDEEYPDEFQRIQEISNGVESPTGYYEGMTNEITVRGGVKRNDCLNTTCKLETVYLSRYNSFKDYMPSKDILPFKVFRKDKKGKVLLFDLVKSFEYEAEMDRKIKALQE